MAAAQSKDRNSQFQSQLLEIWQKLSQSLNPPAPEPLKLNEAIERWWWTKSEGAFKQFETDSYAQGYELLRRLQQYRHQVFFYSHQKQNWPDLHCTDHLLFRSQYRSELTKLGLVKSIGYSAKAIEFDCRLPATYLIEALKEELRRPAPFIAGTYEWSLVPSAMDVKEQSVNAYTKQRKIWELAFAPKPHLIRLPLPESALEGDQYLNYFRTFVKDRPPADFAKHRTVCREKSPRATPKRRPFNSLVNLALTLMLLDCEDIPKLQRWLSKQTTILPNMGIRETKEKSTKRLYNAVQNLQKLLSNNS